jgi:hypothetical protein
MTGLTTAAASSTGLSGASRSPTTPAASAAEKSTTASAARPRRWKLAGERKDAKEPNAAYVKSVIDRYPDVKGWEKKMLVRAALYYGLPIDYPNAEFNEEDRRREAYGGRE